jgi:hypothetical protein
VLRPASNSSNSATVRPSGFAIKKLEREMADPYMKGFFDRSRVCHHSRSACCIGFWSRHKNDFAAGQIAQLLNCVIEVNRNRKL